MKKKKQIKKRQVVDPDASEDNSLIGNTTQHGYTVRGKTHQGGDYMGAESTKVCPPVTSHLSTRHLSSVSQSPSKFSLVNQAPGYQAPVIRATRHWSASHRSSDSKYQAPVISYWSSSHRSFRSDYQAPVTGQQAFNHQALVTGHQSTHQALVIRHQSIGTEYQVANQTHRSAVQSLLNEPQNSTTSKRVLYFSQMSDPSIVNDQPSNI